MGLSKNFVGVMLVLLGTSYQLGKASPQEALRQFYADIDHQDYAGAYGFLAEDWRKELSFGDFVQGFQDCRRPLCRINKVEWRTDRVALEVMLQFQDHRGQAHCMQSQVVVVPAAAGWQLERSDISSYQ